VDIFVRSVSLDFHIRLQWFRLDLISRSLDNPEELAVLSINNKTVVFNVRRLYIGILAVRVIDR
jgi:hypothetical protein